MEGMWGGGGGGGGGVRGAACQFKADDGPRSTRTFKPPPAATASPCPCCCCRCCPSQEPLLALFHKYADAKGKQAKLKVRATHALRRARVDVYALWRCARLPRRPWLPHLPPPPPPLCPPYTLTHTHTHTRTRICTRPPSSLQSPNELQDLLDVTRQLLEGLEATQRAATAGGVGDAAAAGGGGGLSADPDNDEFREKFRIVKASNV